MEWGILAKNPKSRIIFQMRIKIPKSCDGIVVSRTRCIFIMGALPSISVVQDSIAPSKK
jgi:hypothetical protein